MNERIKIEFLISDWDGTLVDSMSDYLKSFTKLMSDLFNIPKEKSNFFYLQTTGQALSRQITDCARKFAGKIVRNTLPLETMFWDNLQGVKPKIIEGSPEFLQEIKNKGIKIIVWSGTRTDILRTNIELLGLSRFVDFAIGNEPGGSELVKGPGLLKLIANNFNISANELSQKSFVIGDGLGDIQAGRAIGARTAGFTRIPNASLEASNPDFFFKNYSELLRKLEE